MKTIEEVAATIYQPIGMSCNEFSVELAKRYAKQLLEEYTNRIVENAEAKVLGTGDTWAEVIDESITSQLPVYLKEIGI